MKPRQKTPRSQPSRTIWFDKEDRDRLALAAMKGFPWGVFNIAELPISFSELISQIQDEDLPDLPRGVGRPQKIDTPGMFQLFRPYEFAPDVGVFIEVKTRDTREAKRCLDYLGFDATFKKKYIEFCKSKGFKESSEWKGPKNYDLLDYLFPCLSNVSGKDLRPILTPDEDSLKKWERRLLMCRTSWDDLRISEGALVSIVHDILKDDLPGFSREAIEKRFHRQKASRRGDNKKLSR